VGTITVVSGKSIFQLTRLAQKQLRRSAFFLSASQNRSGGFSRHYGFTIFSKLADLTHGKGRLNVRWMNIAICERRTELFGQYFPLPQPAVIPSATSCSIHAAANPLAGTSLNTVPEAGGGEYELPYLARKRKIAI